jgi:hypothetical protein
MCLTCVMTTDLVPRLSLTCHGQYTRSGGGSAQRSVQAVHSSPSGVDEESPPRQHFRGGLGQHCCKRVPTGSSNLGVTNLEIGMEQQ